MNLSWGQTNCQICKELTIFKVRKSTPLVPEVANHHDEQPPADWSHRSGKLLSIDERTRPNVVSRFPSLHAFFIAGQNFILAYLVGCDKSSAKRSLLSRKKG